MDFNQQLFEIFDKNGDGKISAEELVTIFNNLGHSFSVEEARNMIKDVGNNDDIITFDEFFEITEDSGTSFSILDTDGSGQISAAELRQKLSEFGKFASDRQLEEFLINADADGNGKIDINEWKQVLGKSKYSHLKLAGTVSEGKSPQLRGVSDLWKTVNHVAIVVSDVGRSVAFYSGVLGMKQILRPDFDRHGAWFTLGNIDLHLIHGRPAVHADDDLIVGHIALNCGGDYDVRQLMSRLRKLNIPYRENVSVPNPATKKQVVQAFVRDPDGYYLEFCSCESLEEFLQEKMTLEKNLWNFKRTKAAMVLKERMIECLNLDQTVAKEKYKLSLKRWGKAKVIKHHGADICKDVTETMIANIASRFESPASILSIIKERKKTSLFANILKNYNTEHISLIFAAGLGDIEALKEGFREGLDINYADSNNRTCLHVAAENGNLECVTFLLRQCLADTTVKDFQGQTPLECAQNGECQATVYILKTAESSFAINDYKELTDEEHEKTKLEVFDWLKKLGDPVKVDEDKFLNLSKRQKTYGDMVQNATKDELKSLLGIFNNNVPDVLFAIREKISAKGRKLFFPPAFYERNLDFYNPRPFAMKMQESGSDILNLAEVMDAASCGNLAILKTAQESGVDLTQKDYDMRTALHLSCAGGNMDCVKFLVEESMVTVDPVDRWGMEPVDYARTAQNTAIVEYLAGKGGKLNVEKNRKFSTALLLDNEISVKKFFS